MGLYGLKTERQATTTLGETGHQGEVFYNLSPVCFVTKHKTIKHFQRLLCVLKVPHVKRGYELLCDEYSAAPPLPAMSLQLPGFYFPWRKMKVSSRLPFLLYD